MSPRTTKNRARYELMQHEQLYRSLVGHSVDSMLIVDIDGRVLVCNQAMTELIGYPIEQIEGHLVTEFMHPDDAMVSLQRIADGTPDSSVHRRLVRKDGSVIPTEATVTSFLSAGRRVGALISYRDLSAQLAVSEALRHSEAQLANAQTLASIGSWEFDVVGDSWRCSDEFYRVVEAERRQMPRARGASQRTVLNTQSLRDLVPNLDVLVGLVSSPSDISGIARSIVVTLRNGEQRFIESRTAVTVDHAGRPVLMEGTAGSGPSASRQ